MQKQGAGAMGLWPWEKLKSNGGYGGQKKGSHERSELAGICMHLLDKRVMLYEKSPEILGVFRVLVHVLNTVV